MTTTTALSITHAARVGADLIDRGLAAGLPGDLSLTACLDFDGAKRHEAARIQFYADDFSDVRAWAALLGVDAVERVSEHDEAVTFCDAWVEVDGVQIRLTGNRRD